MRVYGVPPEQMTGGADFGWRLFGVRTLYLSLAAIAVTNERGPRSYRCRCSTRRCSRTPYGSETIPKRSAVLAMSTAGAIIALDLLRRSSEAPDPD